MSNTPGGGALVLGAANDGTLIITAPQAIEPIRWKGRVTWRVDDRCVEVDLATWHEQRIRSARRGRR